jgi:outer membrane protein assembly factor BamB
MRPNIIRQALRQCIAFGLLSIAGLSARADDWPMFGRDRTRNAVSGEKNPPSWWQVEESKGGKIVRPNKNIKWSASIGSGSSYYHSYADPVVIDGMVWISTNISEERGGKTQHFYALRCFDEQTGKPLSTYLCPRNPPLGAERFLHTLQTSPLIERNRMWFYTNRMEVVCLDIADVRHGKGELREIWKRDLRKDLGVYRAKSIFECRLCSVATHGNYLYVTTGNGVNNFDGDSKVNPKAPSLVCFDKNSGKIVWQDHSPGEKIIHSQFASPTIITIGEKTQIVAPQGDGWLRSFDSATGQLIWEFNTNPPDATDDAFSGNRNYLPATAVLYDNRIYIGNGREPEH